MTVANPKHARAIADGKAPLHLLERCALEAESRVLEHGAGKYGVRNYRDTEMSMSTYVGAMLRHVLAWGSGEDLDPDTGESHLAHLRANTAVLYGAAEAGTLRDDRLDKHTTPRSDAVHAAGNREAKPAAWTEENMRHQHIHRSGGWQEPAGEPPPTRARCNTCSGTDPSLCGRDLSGYVFVLRHADCPLGRPRDYTVDVGGISDIASIVRTYPRGVRFLNHEPEPFIIDAECCIGGEVDSLCCSPVHGSSYLCAWGNGPLVAY